MCGGDAGYNTQGDKLHDTPTYPVATCETGQSHCQTGGEVTTPINFTQIHIVHFTAQNDCQDCSVNCQDTRNDNGSKWGNAILRLDKKKSCWNGGKRRSNSRKEDRKDGAKTGQELRVHHDCCACCSVGFNENWILESWSRGEVGWNRTLELKQKSYTWKNQHDSREFRPIIENEAANDRNVVGIATASLVTWISPLLVHQEDWR